MVTFRESDTGKPLDSEWHEFRQEARENAFSINEFGDEEIVRYDLETARIDGSDNPDTFTGDRPIAILGHEFIDIRKLKNR